MGKASNVKRIWLLEHIYGCGYDSGYEDGHKDGFAKGYRKGSIEGRDKGLKEGKGQGYLEGLEMGYAAGKKDEDIVLIRVGIKDTGRDMRTDLKPGRNK